jgi:bacterial microcompartment shell protein
LHYSERLGATTDPTRAEPSVGLIESGSVAKGYEIADAVVKVSPVELLWARTVSPGHFVVLFAGDVAETDSALEKGLEVGGEHVRDSILIPNVHPDLVPAIRGPRPVEIEEALGIVEFSCVASAVLAADAAVKAAYVDLVEVRLAMHLGGKGFFLLAGETGDVEEAVGVASDLGQSRGTLVERVVIPRVTPELLEHLR